MKPKLKAKILEFPNPKIDVIFYQGIVKLPDNGFLNAQTRLYSQKYFVYRAFRRLAKKLNCDIEWEE